MKKTLMTLCVLCLVFTGNTQAADKSQGWDVVIEPYIFASTIEGDTSLGRVTGVDVDADFGDILDVLDIGAMVHFEAIKAGKWGMVFDYGFMDLGGKVSVAQNGVLSADVRQGVLEAFALRRFERGPNTLDVFGGVRWWDNDIGATVDLMVLPGTPSAKIEQDWIDPVIGVRWRHPINDNWDLMLRGDVGGFGVESDFTSAVGTSFFWKFKSNLALELAYRATWVDFEDGTAQTPGYYAYDTVTHGPLVGLTIGF
ncbi:MAG: hypothetical protein OEV00_02695 [Acidobacteriota bacterium]|nr:hypothetical protein [Acidobacteriota bacterium]MDH3784218.1 hypothetical protein [Acidobacteriota bacterium]